MRFTQVGGDINWQEYGGWFGAEPVDFQGHPTYIFLEFTNFEEATGELYNGHRYVIEVKVVCPDLVRESKPEEIESALQSFGQTGEDLDDAALAQVLAEYGLAAVVLSVSSNNCWKLLREVQRRVRNEIVPFLYSYLSWPENRIGSTGFDFLRGDILAGLYRRH